MGLLDFQTIFTLLLPRLPLILVISGGVIYAITQLHLGAPAKYIMGAGVLVLINIVLGVVFQVWVINNSTFGSPLYIVYGIFSVILDVASWVLILVAVFIGRTEPIKKDFEGYQP